MFRGFLPQLVLTLLGFGGQVGLGDGQTPLHLLDQLPRGSVMGRGGISFLMTQRVADIPTVNTHPPPPIPPPIPPSCLFLPVRSHRHAYGLSWLFRLFFSPPEFTAGIGGGRTERESTRVCECVCVWGGDAHN